MLCTVNVISLYLQGLHFHSPTYRYVLMDVKRYNNHVCLLPAVPIRYMDTAGGRAKRAHLLVILYYYNAYYQGYHVLHRPPVLYWLLRMTLISN